MARKISVEIVGDSRSLERAFARSSRAGEKFNRTMTGRFTATARGFNAARASVVGFGAAIVGGAAAKGIATLVTAASDLNEEMNRTKVTFGRSSREILDWSNTTAEAIGLSSQAALEGANNFGAMFRTVGEAAPQAATMSRRMVQLAADMASFNNQDPAEMLDRLRSGLAGEAEPLRRFGILLSEARVKQEAYRSGLARVGANLTEAQKVQARYNLILRDSRLQQGDFARTSGGLANQLRTLRAQFGDLAAKLGKTLLPAVTELVDNFNEWLSDPENQERVIRDFTQAIEVLGTTAKTTAQFVKFLGDTWDTSLIDVFRSHSRLARMRDQPGPPLPTRGLLREHLDIQRRAMDRLPRTAGPGGGLLTGPGGGAGARRGITAAQRNQFFDMRIARQLDRLQDASLRKQLAGLRAIAQQVRERLAGTKDATRRLTLEDQLLDIYREQRSVQEQITSQIQAANAALKERADAIKSAVLERLQRRQTDILNKRALADAKEQLRIARQLGGPMGIRAAQRGLQDVRLDMLMARVQGAPATLNRRGQFALGNIVTINIHGVTNPDEVARRVAAVLQKRRRRTTSQSRGPAPGSPAGAH